MIFKMLVPRKKSLLRRRILPRSAIVSRIDDREPDWTIIDYEGNAYDIASLQRYRSKLLAAAGRSKEHNPTIARIRIRTEHVAANSSASASLMMTLKHCRSI